MDPYLVPAILGTASITLLLVSAIQQIRAEAKLQKELRAAGHDGSARFIILYIVMVVLCCLGLAATIPLICRCIWG